MSKKLIGSVMTGALVLSLIAPAVPAAPVDAAGKVTYKVKGTTLTISGKGEMPKSMVFGKKSKTKNIKKVVIKKGVTTISKNAFKNCKKLKKVQLPSTLKKISGYAFYNTAITNVTIPNSVKYIGNYSFYKCKKLKKVSTPADLYAYNRVDEKGVINDTPLEQLTFTSAIKSLNDISLNQFDTRAYVVNKNDKNFSSYKGAIYNKKGDTLMYLALYAKQAEVKPSCESILTSAFTNDLGDDNYVPVKELKEFKIPAGVKNIVEDGEPLPAGIQYSVLSKDLTKESVAVLFGTIGEKEAMRQMPERISFAGDYVVIDKTYLAKFADKADAKKKAEEEAKNQKAQTEEAASGDASEDAKKDDKNTDETEAEDASSEEESEDLVYKNGTYTGDGQGFGGNIQVQVTLENDTITDIQVVSAPGEDSAYLSQGQGVISTILAAQSTDVDTISGATFSSTGIINAVNDALGKAENQ